VVTLPPQRAPDPGGERAGLGSADVDRGRVVERRVVAEDRLLPGGDAERVEILLGAEERLVVLLVARVRDQPLDERHGTFVEGPGRDARLVALDPPVHRVRRPPVDPRQG
jgi:hypothetical protein